MTTSSAVSITAVSENDSYFGWPMVLLERERSLHVLVELLDRARQGNGRVALIRGEAGIGKTSVVNEFMGVIEEPHVLWGGCDDLMAARPFGPFWDMAVDEPEMHQALQRSDRQATLNVVLDLLSRALRPTVMVIEDVHWADDATLDVIKFVGRRIDRTHGLLVLTYRDGEVRGDHPLRVALGDLPYGLVERIPLEPLTEEGVGALVGEGVDGHSLWKISGGNPFFVTEAISSGGDVPLSIRDAVNSRVQRLSDEARSLVELTSVAPSKIELVVLKEILGDVADAIAECERAGILELSGDSLRFRHELTRRAVERELPSITRRRLNSLCLGACERLGIDLARCAHHAREAEDAEAMVRILPEAARRASDVQSHAEALATLRALQPHLEMMTQEDLADHYDLWAYEEYLRADKGLDIIKKAIDLRTRLGDPAALANSLLIASRLAWVGSYRDQAIAYAEQAAEVVGDVGGEDLARSYSVLSQLAMLGGFADDAAAWAEKALALTGEGDGQVRAHALNNIGSVRMVSDVDDGRDDLVESKRISASLDLVQDEARACVNLAWNYLVNFELDEAIHWIDEGLRVAGAAEMPSYESYLQVEKAWWHEMRGEWTEAETILNALVESSSESMSTRTAPLTLLAKIYLRRGSVTRDLIDDAVELAENSAEAQRLGPTYAMLAEYRWLGGELTGEEVARTVEVMEWCFDRLNRWSAGMIGQWLVLMDLIDELPDRAPEPYRLLAEGDWAASAAWWGERGIIYERAVALSHGDTDARLEALQILDGLGAVPLATRIRGQLQAEGVTGIPRGPQKTTLDNPLGLTARQTEVLELLVDDLTNAEIADRLFISTRTVDHHVSAILAKLGASSRSEAVDKARQGPATV